MDGSSTRRCPLPWLVSGRKIAMKLDEFGQAVANARSGMMPSDDGEGQRDHAGDAGHGARAVVGTAAMSLSTA